MLFHTQLGKAFRYGAVFMEGGHFHVETGKGKTKTVAKKLEAHYEPKKMVSNF